MQKIYIHTLSFPGTTIATGMSVNYKDENGEFCSLKLSAPDTSVKKQSMTWIAAMQKVHTLIHLSIAESETLFILKSEL